MKLSENAQAHVAHASACRVGTHADARQTMILLTIITLALICPCTAAINDAPSYTAAGIVNAADSKVRPLAPNTIASLYGVRLSYVTQSITAQDIRGGLLPTVLPGTGVEVLVRNFPAAIYYVSPNQINFLVPANLLPGQATVQVVLDAHYGPAVDIQLAAASPALFQLDAHTAVALHPDGTVITPKASSKPGDIIILYANGLGQITPPVSDAQIMTQAAPLELLSEFKLLLDGAVAGSVLYAGIAPGFAGLY